MAFYPVPNSAQVRFIMSFRGQQCINTMWFTFASGPPSITDVQALAVDATLKWESGPLSLMSSDVRLLQVIAKDYTAADSWETARASVAEGAAGDAMPNNVALAFKLDTGMSGRAKRGRVYIGGIPRAAVVENDVTAAGFLDDMLISLGGFVGLGLVSDGWTLVVAHRRSNNAWLSVGQTFTVQQIVVTDTVVDSQRRRLPGRGN